MHLHYKNFRFFNFTIGTCFFLVGFIVISVFSSCTDSTKFTVDPETKDTVQRKLGPKPNNLAYQNELIAEMALDGKIVRTKKVSDILSFRTFHFWDGDTLKIAGGFGVESGYGFIAKIHNENATVYHLIFSEADAVYSLTRKGKKKERIEVPCESWDLKISSIPRKNSNTAIYGIISFKSSIYYEKDGKQIHSHQVDMDLHFFSRNGF
ncbi:MAG: hypothetical protein ACHQF2_00635 [Flavobacteriales bacterium]